MSLKVDLIVAMGTAAVSVGQTTNMIPIAMVYVIDPVASGIIDSYARPGGNVTGVAFGTGLEIVGKHLELLKEAIPKVSRVAALSDPVHPLDATIGRRRKQRRGSRRHASIS